MVKRWGALPLIVAVVTGVLALIPTANVSAPYEMPPSEYSPVLECDLAITMSDGIRLRADLTTPGGLTGPLPTIVSVTAYNKSPGGYGCNGSSGLGGNGLTWAAQGYNFLLVDERGTGNSEGQWGAWGPESQKDHEELIDWIVDQPWSDGTIAATGESYGAVTSLFLAQADARRVERGETEAVKAIWAKVPVADPYRDQTLQGGQPHMAFTPAWLGVVTALGAFPPTWWAEDPDAAMQMGADHLTGIVDFQFGMGSDVVIGGDRSYDGDFWQVRSTITEASKLTIPVAWVGGWRDLFQRGQVLLFEELDNSAKRLWFQTPIYHMSGDSNWADQGIGSETAVKSAWFDHWLRGADNGVEDLPSVNVFTMGRDRWQHGETFPPTGTEYHRLYLTDGSELTREPPAAGEVTTALLPSGVCSRTMSQGIGGLGLDRTPCDTDQRIDEATSATFTLPAAATPLEIGGPLTATIYATLHQPDATFSVTVNDVAPDGSSTMITSGTLQASQRALEPCEADGGRTQCRAPDGEINWAFHPFTREAQADVPIGVPTEYVIEVFPTSYEIQPGHALRLSVSGINIPHVAPVLRAAGAIPPVVTIHTGGDFASRLLVPEVPSQD